jgi:flagellar biosynthesis/type III secretory pathway chaperone
VDFSEAFAPLLELDPENDIAKCSKDLFLNLQKVKSDELKTILKGHLNDEEIGALLKRKDMIIEKIKRLIGEKGENAVLF